MKTLIDLFNEKADIDFNDIPIYWRSSYDQFIIGQTCAIINGVMMSYYNDFAVWYNINREAIERDNKISEVLKSKQ